MTEAKATGERRPAILHYHLFKNAGTSLDALFKEQFPGGWVTAEFPGAPEASRQGMAAWIAEHPEAACFSTHTGLLPAPDVDGRAITPVIFVRHPLDRIASAWSFERKQRDTGFGATLAQNTTMRGYIAVRLSMPEDRQCRNFHTERLAGLFPDDPAPEVDRAVRAVRELPFVGVVEEFGRSLEVLQELLRGRGFPEVELSSVRKNASGRADSLGARLERMAEELGTEFFEELVRVNADDLAVYHEAVLRLEGVSAVA